MQDQQQTPDQNQIPEPIADKENKPPVDMIVDIDTLKILIEVTQSSWVHLPRMAMAIKKLSKELSATILKNKDLIRSVVDTMSRTMDYVADELDNIFAELQYDPTLDEFLTSPDFEELMNEAFDKALEKAAKLAIEEYEKKENPQDQTGEEKEVIPIVVQALKSIDYPVDKVNGNIWRLGEEDASTLLPVAMEKKSGSRKTDPAEINTYYQIDFDALSKGGVTVTKKLTAFDKRVYTAVSALFNAGHAHFTVSNIYQAMGNKGRPAQSQVSKINESLDKMMRAAITLDNTAEAEAYKYKKFKYNGALLPMERVTVETRGQLTETAIHLFREPPAMSFARGRGQITTIPVELLQAPVSKTGANLEIEDYLLERLARAAVGRGQAKILYSTIQDKAGITEKKQKQRLPDKVKKYLDHFRSCGKIKGYKEEPDGVTLLFK